MKRDKVQGASAVMSREDSTTPSRPEAVRRAVEALGYRAGVTEILDYVREHFGIDAAAAPPGEAAASPRSRPRNRAGSSE
jgi:hypothetical protein